MRRYKMPSGSSENCPESYWRFKLLCFLDLVEIANKGPDAGRARTEYQIGTTRGSSQVSMFDSVWTSKASVQSKDSISSLHGFPVLGRPWLPGQYLIGRQCQAKEEMVKEMIARQVLCGASDFPPSCGAKLFMVTRDF